MKIKYSSNFYSGKQEEKSAGIRQHFPVGPFILMVLALLCGSSCSSQIQVNLERFYRAQIDITLNFAPFFAQYLYDLMGKETIQELVEEEALKEYLRSLDAMQEAHVLYPEEPHTVLLRLRTLDFISTLVDMNVIKNREMLRKNMQKIQFQISKDTIQRILTELPKYNNPAIQNAFFPENNTFAQSDYPGYLAWALSDYEEQEVIKKWVIDSEIYIELTKEKGYGLMPDEHWELDKEKENTQTLSIPFTAMLKDKKSFLSFSF